MVINNNNNNNNNVGGHSVKYQIMAVGTMVGEMVILRSIFR